MVINMLIKDLLHIDTITNGWFSITSYTIGVGAVDFELSIIRVFKFHVISFQKKKTE